MEQLESDDYFEVLGLARSATEVDVKRAYRRLAVLWHPDKNRTHPKAEEYFKKIAEAYAVLSDAEQRKMYERYGKAGPGGDGGGNGASPSEERFYDDHFGFGFGGHAGHAGFSARHARDIFEAFFGGMDPFEEFFHGNGGDGRRQSRNRSANEWDPMGFGGMGMSMRGGGLGNMMMMDSFFNGGGMGMDMGGFADFGSFNGAGGGGGSFSSSVSSSSFTDRNGHVVTKKTTTTVDATGHSETVTEEFRDGRLVNSSSTTYRVADADRMQLEGTGGNDGARDSSSSSSSSAAAATTPLPHRLSSSSSRKRF